MRRITIDNARALFRERGCTLLSDEINNVRESLSFVCSCGRLSRISYDKFRGGQLCGGCRWERMAASQRHTLNYIREVFAINGCELLSADYISNKDKLKFKCNCGAISEISFAKFQAGQRCRNCKGIRISEKISGPNNPHWRLDLTAEQRTKERTIPGYNEWRRAVFERDNYTCVACEERGRTLNAHHLESYARVPEKRTDLDNGVTLCRECHTEYHSKILHNDADHDSFTFFLTEYREPWYAGEDVCDG